MVQTSYSEDGLFDMAVQNYRRLAEFCGMLDEEGYWDKPEQVLNQSAFDVLELYVQAVLINFSVFCGRFFEKQKNFIINLPQCNRIGLTAEENVDNNILIMANRIMAAPPILLQLCGLRDFEKNSTTAGQFVDCMLNVFLAMASMDRQMESFTGKFIQEYYQKISVFLNNTEKENGINPRYIFKKLSGDWTEDSYFNIIEKKPSRVNDSRLRIKTKEASKSEILDEVREKLEEEQVTQIREQIRENRSGETLDSLIEKLEELVGLDEVKQEINSLVNLIKVRKLREAYNMPSLDMTWHMVFTGNPGTGKTTVARLVAKIYKELGLLTEGSLTETDRSGLVAGYVGQTALKVKEVVEKAIGGVLFIDEAYALTDQNSSNDYGKEAIDTLVKLMEDNRDNLVVIVAGYTKEMKNFLKSNTGLISRFNKFIEFPDYSQQELLEIMVGMAGDAGVIIEEEAKKLIGRRISEMSSVKRKRYGNARGIRNTFEKIIVNQANRIVNYENPTAEDLKRIVTEDIPEV